MHHTKPYGDHAARHAAELAAREERLLDSASGRAAPVAPVGSTAVLLLGLWVWVSFPLLSLSGSAAGWDTSLRDEGAAVVLVLAGSALRLRPRSTLAGVLAVAAGIALVAFGVWAPHGAQRAAVNEVLTGLAATGAAMIALSCTRCSTRAAPRGGDHASS